MDKKDNENTCGKLEKKNYRRICRILQYSQKFEQIKFLKKQESIKNSFTIIHSNLNVRNFK